MTITASRDAAHFLYEVQEVLMPTARADIDNFLGHRRIAMVGVSRDPKHFSRYLLKEFRTRGYDVVAVNPTADEIEGNHCFATVKAIQPPVEAALLMTPPPETEKVVHDCAEAGIQEVWMHRGGGQGSVSSAAVAFCRKQGMQFPHRVHGFIKKLVGSFPRA